MLGINPSFLDLHTYKNCFSWKKLTYLVGTLYWVVHESIQNLPEKHSSSSYFAYDKYAIVSLTKNLLWNVRHSSVQTFFFENYHQLSSNSVHFPSSSKKIFRFTFFARFFGFSFVLCLRNERNLWPNHGVKPILSEEIFTANAFSYILFFYIGTFI